MWSAATCHAPWLLLVNSVADFAGGRQTHVHYGTQSRHQGGLRSAPVRMLPRVCAPAQPLEVEVPRVAEEVPQLGEEAIGYMAQPKHSDVLTPALRAAGTHGVFGIGLCRFTQAMTPCSSLNEWLSLIHSLTMASTGRHRTLHELYCWHRGSRCPLWVRSRHVRRKKRGPLYPE